MRRRSRASSKLANARSRKAKTRKAARHSGPDALQNQLNQPTHELGEAQRHLSEALEQQAATSETLRVVRSSPRNVQPVFDAVAQSAARLCESLDSSVWRREGDRLLLVSHHGAIPQAGTESLPLVRGTVGGRSVLDGRIVHITYRMREEFVPHCSEGCWRALQWEQWAVVRLMWKELLRARDVSRRN